MLATTSSGLEVKEAEEQPDDDDHGDRDSVGGDVRERVRPASTAERAIGSERAVDEPLAQVVRGRSP